MVKRLQIQRKVKEKRVIRNEWDFLAARLWGLLKANRGHYYTMKALNEFLGTDEKGLKRVFKVAGIPPNAEMIGLDKEGVE